jgi:hypothetical protein
MPLSSFSSDVDAFTVWCLLRSTLSKGIANHIGLIDFFDFVITFLSDQGTACRESDRRQEVRRPQNSNDGPEQRERIPHPAHLEGVGFIVVAVVNPNLIIVASLVIVVIWRRAR